MKISSKGLDIIKEFEGYEKKLPDGSCKAYQDYLGNGKYDIPTIGWGCTEGVSMGDVWTVEQAETGLRHEVSKHEDAVTSLCQFVPNQNQFDAMVSFTYNEGAGTFGKSSILRKANQGDFKGAAQAFLLYNKAQGQTLSGLARRRHMEAALFLTPSEDSVPFQKAVQADEPVEPLSPASTSVLHNGTQAVAGGGILVGGLASLGLDPAGLISLVQTYGIPITIAGCALIFVVIEALKYWKSTHA